MIPVVRAPQPFLDLTRLSATTSIDLLTYRPDGKCCSIWDLTRNTKFHKMSSFPSPWRPTERPTSSGSMKA